jgi:DNA repair protein RadD
LGEYFKVKPRDYQSDAIDSIFKYFEEHDGNPIVAMPTGTGKSVVIAFFISYVLQHFKSERFLVLTHVKELIEQNYEKLKIVRPDLIVGINSASIGRRDTIEQVIFAGFTHEPAERLTSKLMRFTDKALEFVFYLVTPSKV